VTHAAIDGMGFAFMSGEKAAPYLATGALIRVLASRFRACFAQAMSFSKVHRRFTQFRVLALCFWPLGAIDKHQKLSL
jgi:hypothetical protein